MKTETSKVKGKPLTSGSLKPSFGVALSLLSDGVSGSSLERSRRGMRLPAFFVATHGFKSDAVVLKFYGPSKVTVITKTGREREPQVAISLEDALMLTSIGFLRHLSSTEVPKLIRNA